MGIQNKQKRIAKSKTPQPPKKVKGHGQVKTPQSAPPVKRKNLAQEIDEELSDLDFDDLLKKVKVAEGNRSENGRPAKKVDSEEDDSDDFSVDDDGEEQETSDDDEFDEDDDDDFSESDDDEVSSSVFESPKITSKKQTPSKQKLAEMKSTPNKQKLLETKSTPSKQKLLEAKSTPNKQKLLEAKSTPSKQKLLETKKKTPSQEKLAKSTPGKHKLSEPVSAKKKNLPESKSGSDQKVLTKTASNQKLSGKLKTKAAQLLVEAIEDDDDDSVEEEESLDDEEDEEFDEDDGDENDSDDDEEDSEDDDGDEEDESDNDVEVAPKKQRLAAAVTVKEKQNEKKTVKKTDYVMYIMDEAFNSEKSMLEERDKRTLFVKNLPEIVTETQIKSLSADIVTIRIRKSFRQNSKNNRFAFLEFKNEKIAIKNLKQLKGRTIDNVTLVFDFVGQKSKNNPKSVQPVNPADIDPTKLFVTGFEREMTEAQLKALFPTANEVSLPTRKSDGKPIGFAFVTYASAAKCKEVHDKMQSHVHKGRLLIVLYGKKRTDQGKRKSDSETETPSKKQKKALAKEESSDDDSDEDDDDDDDGDDDDDDDDDEEMDSDDEEMESGDDDDSDED